jgi:hypothetical protein
MGHQLVDGLGKVGDLHDGLVAHGRVGRVSLADPHEHGR